MNLDSKSIRFLAAAGGAFGALLMLAVIITTYGPAAPGFFDSEMFGGSTLTSAASNASSWVSAHGTINGGTLNLTVPVGTAVTYAGTAVDADGGMTDHWLEVQNPQGKWSWEGWLTTPEWSSGLKGNGYSSTKQASITLTSPGTYTFRTTAIDEHKSWVISNYITVTAVAGAQQATGGGASSQTSQASSNSGASDTTGLIYCAQESQTCSFSGTKIVRYGANGKYVTKTLSNGTPCTNAVFGDPISGTLKYCYIQTQDEKSPGTSPATNPGTNTGGTGSTGTQNPVSQKPVPTTPAPIPCNSVGTNAFFACYFSDIGLGTVALTRTDQSINFDWGTGSPDPTIPANGFSARWTGNFSFVAGTYTFTATTDDGMRVYVDGNIVINSWKDQAPTTYASTVHLNAGTHLVNVQYYENTGGAVAKLSWALQSASTPTPTTPTPKPPVTPPSPQTPTSTPATPTTPDTTPQAPVSALYSTVLAQNYGWNNALIESELGPSYANMHPGTITEDRPTLYMPPSKTPRSGAWWRINPYQVGGPDVADSDYWSVEGQAGYLPDSPTNDPGMARIQTFAYYDQVFAIAPKLENAIDPVMTGFRAPMQHVIASERNYDQTQNEALVLFDSGYMSFVTTQTSRNWDGGEKNWPVISWPADKIATNVAITTGNELALVTVWDKTTHKGQLAVIALEGKYLPFHTLPYMGLINQGSWSDFKLLGYIDLPFSYPTEVAAASNGTWHGPSETDNKTLGQIDLSKASTRSTILNSWKFMVATKGYAVVASKTENKVAFVDLTPVFSYLRNSYLSDFDNTIATRGDADNQFPKTFTAKPDIMPTVTATYTVTAPTSVLAGLEVERWSTEVPKAYVATEDGTVHAYDTSSWIYRPDWITDKTPTPLHEISSFYACKNPTSMAFVRFLDSNSAMGIPAGKTASKLNDAFWLACRGDREIATAAFYGGTGRVYRTIKDVRMDDPVAVMVADRGNIVTVADFNGKKLLTFRLGNLRSRNGVDHGPGASGNDPYELGGILNLPGKPFTLSNVNVN